MLLTDLPNDATALILVRLERARDIARTAPTCRALRDAARHAEKAHRLVCFEVRRPVTITGVAAASDRIITSSDDGSLREWYNGVCLREHVGLGHSVLGVAMLADGAHFVGLGLDVGGNEASVQAKLYKLRPAPLAYEYTGLGPGCVNNDSFVRAIRSRDYMSCVASLPDGVHFVVGTHHWTGDTLCFEVKLYHVDGTLVHTFKGHTSHVSSVAVARDGRHIVSASGLCLKVWSVATKSLVGTCWPPGTDEGRSICVTAPMPDGQRIVGGTNDGDIGVWSLRGNLEAWWEQLHVGLVRAIVALPDNQHALSGSQDATVKLFNVNDGVVLRTFTLHTRPVHCLALLPDGLRFVSGSSDGTARIAEIGLLR